MSLLKIRDKRSKLAGFDSGSPGDNTAFVEQYILDRKSDSDTAKELVDLYRMDRLLSLGRFSESEKLDSEEYVKALGSLRYASAKGAAYTETAAHNMLKNSKASVSTDSAVKDFFGYNPDMMLSPEQREARDSAFRRRAERDSPHVPLRSGDRDAIYSEHFAHLSLPYATNRAEKFFREHGQNSHAFNREFRQTVLEHPEKFGFSREFLEALKHTDPEDVPDLMRSLERDGDSDRLHSRQYLIQTEQDAVTKSSIFRRSHQKSPVTAPFDSDGNLLFGRIRSERIVTPPLSKEEETERSRKKRDDGN